jgi:hypothetical protein
VTDLREIATLVRNAPVEALPALVGALAEAEATARLRLAREAGPRATGEAEGPPPRLLTVSEAAGAARVTARSFLRITRGRGFRRKLGRAVLFEEAGLRRWLGGRT